MTHDYDNVVVSTYIYREGENHVDDATTRVTTLTLSVFPNRSADDANKWKAAEKHAYGGINWTCNETAARRHFERMLQTLRAREEVALTEGRFVEAGFVENLSQ